MACKAGCCGSCVFAYRVGDEGACLAECNIQNDPVVQETYERLYPGGVCSKYQLNPAALED